MKSLFNILLIMIVIIVGGAGANAGVIEKSFNDHGVVKVIKLDAQNDVVDLSAELGKYSLHEIIENHYIIENIVLDEQIAVKTTIESIPISEINLGDPIRYYSSMHNNMSDKLKFSIPLHQNGCFIRRTQHRS